MPEVTLAQLRSLPLPLDQNPLLRRRQFIRQKLNAKIHQLREIQNKCDFEMCNHMDPYTVDLYMGWCPLKAELDFFFMNQPWAYLGLYVYPHCIDCLDSTVCGRSI